MPWGGGTSSSNHTGVQQWERGGSQAIGFRLLPSLQAHLRHGEEEVATPPPEGDSSRQPAFTSEGVATPRSKEWRPLCNPERTFSVETARSSACLLGRIHIIQWMYGCELSSDGRKGGYWQYGYDGRDFVAFDKETLTWTAADPQAQVSKRKLDANLAWNHGRKHYLEEECIEWLQRHLDYGNETLLRKEAPVVKVTRKAGSEGTETLVCQVHGFYPKEIDAKWVKDGEVWQEGTSRGLVAPNSDGTFYVLLSVTIDPQERERYLCRVEHGSLEEPLDVAWEKEPVNWGLIVGVILGVLAAILLVSGIIFFIHRKRSKKSDYKAASTSDQGSDSSAKASDQPRV